MVIDVENGKTPNDEQGIIKSEQKEKKPLEKKFLIYYSVAFLVFALVILTLSYLSTLKQQGMNEELKNEVSQKVEAGISALARLDTLTQENAAYHSENAELKAEIENLRESVSDLEAGLSESKSVLADAGERLAAQREFIAAVTAFYTNDPDAEQMYNSFIEERAEICSDDEFKPMLEAMAKKF